ncbi:MAG: cation:proton antiporter [Candidatus Woesearchaeota archaeon]
MIDQRCGMLLAQFVYVAVLILVGIIILFLRRKAGCTRTGYKLVLVLLGILLGSSVTENSLLSFDHGFLKSFSMFLLIVLLFELSVRLNPENIRLTFESVSMFFGILTLNIILLGIVTTLLLDISFVYGVVFAILLSSVEYFLVDKLKSEGDLANPLILFFTFSIVLFYGLEGSMSNNIVYFLKYILIGLGMGVLVSIIVFRILRNKYTSPANELGLIAVAVATYIFTEQLAGSGLFAVLLLGTFFGNSYVRKTSNMHSFSPFIFKTLELLIFLMIGFVAVLTLRNGLWWKALLLFLIYIFLRLIIIYIYFRHYSINNKLLLAFAPKGMILGVSILVLGLYNSVSSILISVMLFVLIYSLAAGVVVEYVEQQKSLRIDRSIKILMSRRFGRKRDLLHKKK